jgi:hypothetical protein
METSFTSINLKGTWTSNFLDEVEEKALIFINGIEMGIY